MNISIKRMTESKWRDTGFGFEKFTKGLQVFNTQLVSDLAD